MYIFHINVDVGEISPVKHSLKYNIFILVYTIIFILIVLIYTLCIYWIKWSTYYSCFVCVAAVCIHSGHTTSTLFSLSCDLYVHSPMTYENNLLEVLQLAGPHGIEASIHHILKNLGGNMSFLLRDFWHFTYFSCWFMHSIYFGRKWF